jgi:hypothetical protein
MVRGSVAAAAFIGLMVVARSPEVGACSGPAQLTDVIPVGAEHPANAAVILRGAWLSADGIAATIDGVPVQVVIDESLSIARGITPAGWSVLALRLEPAPAAGQSVVVSGSPCGEDPEPCPAIEIAYVATEPDLSFDGLSPEFSFDLLRYTTAWQTSCGDYGSVIRTTFDLTTGDLEGEAFVMFEIHARNYPNGITDDRVIREDASALPPFSVHYLEPELIGDAFPLDGWCVQYDLYDAAGNPGTSIASCDACMFAEAEAGVEDPELSPIPGSVCDDGSATTDATTGTSSDGSSEGSSDSATSDPPPGTESGPRLETSDGSVGEDASGDDETTGAPTQDEDNVPTRGCGCTHERRPSSFAFLLVFAFRRRR